MYKKGIDEHGERPFFESQIIRGKVFALTNKNKLDRDQIIEIAKKGFKPKFSSYKRHRKQILKLLNRVSIHKNELD
jgi:hypothetical protein